MSEEAVSLAQRTIVASRYDILGLIGTGGMGCVYRARDSKLDEIVALKMLARELAQTPGMLERFMQEVKLARKVTHRNVARTYDLGEDNGVHFLTMELVEGESLSARLSRSGRLSINDSIEIACQVCDGLSAAHAAGVVHRDLKPDNVLISKDGRAVLTDFGIARALEKVGMHTMGSPVGTPAYMAPEQVEASPDVDARADQYALGVMLYEMLTGTLPFNGSSAYAIAAARLIQPPPDPRTVRPDLPDALANVIARCMSRKPEDRFTTMMEIATRLGSATLPAMSAPPPPMASGPQLVETQTLGKTVAVLPMRNGSGPEHEYLAEGLTDDLIDSLSMTPGLRVRPRSAVMSLGQGRDPRDVGRELGVQVVIEGSIRVGPESARINVRLLSVVDGFQLWAKRFDIPKGDILRAADEAATAIAEALTVEKKERPVITDAEAVDLYLRGRNEYYKFEPDAIERAIELFEKAIAIRPDDPLILSAFAATCARRMNQSDGSFDLQQRARTAARRALEIAPSLPDAHAAMGVVEMQVGDAVNAAMHVHKALELNPNHADAHDIAVRLLVETGPKEAAEKHAAKALAAEPRIVVLPFMLVRFAVLAKDIDAFDETYARPSPDYLRPFAWTSRVRYVLWMRDRERAKEALDAIQKLPPFLRQDILITLARLIVAGEDNHEVRAYFARFQATRGRAGAFFGQLAAELECFLGNHEAAMVWVRHATTHGLFDIVWFDRCPLLDPLRAHPDWPTLRAEVEGRATSVRQALLGRHRA